MAMLLTNEVFARTWGERAGAPPAEEYWPPLIARVKAEHPELLFIAEAYWDMEWTLQQQGFDFCYDKRLYDRLAHDPVDSIRGHLHADSAYQERLIRFIENHDEPRAAATFAPAKARAAAVAFSTLEGARLFHDGQLDGFHTHIPVFLGRGPDEPADAGLHEFYGRLLSGDRGFRAAHRGLAAVRHERVGRTTPHTSSCSRGAGDPTARAISSSSTTRTPRRRPACGCPGTTSPDRTWSIARRRSAGRASIVTGASSPPTDCTSGSTRGSRTCSRSADPEREATLRMALQLRGSRPAPERPSGS